MPRVERTFAIGLSRYEQHRVVVMQCDFIVVWMDCFRYVSPTNLHKHILGKVLLHTFLTRGMGYQAVQHIVVNACSHIHACIFSTQWTMGCRSPAPQYKHHNGDDADDEDAADQPHHVFRAAGWAVSTPAEVIERRRARAPSY